MDPDTDERVVVTIASEEGIAAAISDATLVVAGEGQQIKNVLMELTVCSPEVPDLTVLDLPGITHVPMGDQPKDIFVQVKALYDAYCTGKHLLYSSTTTSVIAKAWAPLK